MSYFVYVLRSINYNRLYTGYTEELKQRLMDHNYGLVGSTKAYKPWQLIYYEAHRNKTLARKAEIFYKTGQGRRQLKKKLGLDD